jgi:hypothetical protein
MPHVHGSNARNLSVYLSLSQTSKNAMSFLLSLVFSSAKSKKRGGTDSAWKWVWGEWRGIQTMYTHVSKCKNDKIKKLKKNLNKKCLVSKGSYYFVGYWHTHKHIISFIRYSLVKSYG